LNSQDVDRKDKLDPLVKMNELLDQTRKSESLKNHKQKKEKKKHKVVNVCCIDG
jgi:hypothetical protein